MKNRVSGQLLDFVKLHEGCKLQAYQDQGGVWTIGYGTTGPNITKGLFITQSEADYFLANTLEKVVDAVSRLVKVKLKPNQLDAVSSLVYNIGAGAFQHSTLLNLLNTKQFDKAGDEFLKWDHVHGAEVKGLTLRRMAERRLFFS